MKKTFQISLKSGISFALKNIFEKFLTKDDNGNITEIFDNKRTKG